jgi:uncharacterized hydrophobic protein (TIGR00271 family)
MSDRFNTEDHMREAVFFDGPLSRQRYSRFWLLLILAAVIASAGVVADSTATVIGAMIVAPLMTPILGVMLATVLGDRENLIRSLILVTAGAVTAIAIGFLVGMLVTGDVLAETNPQVAARVSPRLIDLLAALGTGVVGSIALVRRDISDTLPGVAIAISLVPPLTVVGLALESGSLPQSLGALLLFLTNVVAIIGTGIVVMTIYGVNSFSNRVTTTDGSRVSLARPIAVLAVMLVVIGLPLTFTSVDVASRAIRESAVQTVADDWAQAAGWEVLSVSSRGSEVVIRAEGPLPVPETGSLTTRLVAAGIDAETVTVRLQPVYSEELSAP